MDRIFVAIGGGELRSKTTLEIDKAIANIAKERAGQRRANALFFPTASHDSLPYFNTFRKTFTSELSMKSDVALLTKKDIPMQKIEEKIATADLIYLGGGDTLHLIEVMQEKGVDKLILDAYSRGAVLAGLSAGGICWFEKMYSDTDIVRNGSLNYRIYKGLRTINGLVCPHYNNRQKDFDNTLKGLATMAYAIEDNGAILFVNEKLSHSLTSGGKSYLINAGCDTLIKTLI